MSTASVGEILLWETGCQEISSLSVKTLDSQQKALRMVIQKDERVCFEYTINTLVDRS